MAFLNDLFGSEINELKNHAKTEEEIKKFCTSEDLTELKRAVHLMKKGYEIQKISVINHLEKYLTEVGANDELLQLIIDSMTLWDDNMQIECANSFIAPIMQNLVDKKNKQKILKIAVDIVSSDDNASNDKLTDPWFSVFDVLVKNVDWDFALKQIFPVIMELPGLKNPFPKRKRGNKLVASFAKQVGEEGFDKEPMIIKIMMGICHDNNYKIRMDGVIFLKEYLLVDERVKNHQRFKDLYIPEVIELLNDEEAYIRIEALEIITDSLEFLTEQEVEDEYVQAVLKTIDVGIEEIVLRLASMFGKVVHQLKPYELHIKYKQQFIEFFHVMCYHKDIEMRRHGAFNLPCFNLLYGTSFHLDCQEIYLKFSKEDDQQIQKTIAASLHQAFSLTTQEEDSQKLRDAFKILIEENEKDVLIAISQNLDISLRNYCNENAVKVYAPILLNRESSSTPNGKESGLLYLPKGSSTAEFTTALSTKHAKEERKAQSSKKLLSTPLTVELINTDEQQMISQNIILPEYNSEILFSDLLVKLVIFDQNLKGQYGLWRSQIKYLQNLSKTVHLFNSQDLYEAIIPSLFDYIRSGNAEVRQAASECVSKLLQYQYSSPKRSELIGSIKVDLAQSSSCILRKTYIYFCKAAVNCFSRSFFKQHFLAGYMALSTDKVATVRMEFAHSIVTIKPYLDHDVNLNLELMDIINKLKSDPDRDVVEAVEQCDFKLLQQRKRSKEEEKSLITQDQELTDLELRLKEREIKEDEERKKRMEEEEEQKFDFQTLLAESSKKFKNLQKGKFSHFSVGRKGFGTLASKPQVSSGSTSTKAGQSNGLLSIDKTPTKKKTSMLGSTTKKSETITSGTSSTLKLPPNGGGIQANEKKSSVASSIGTNGGDFNKRHSVLITSSSNMGTGLTANGAQAQSIQSTLPKGGVKTYGRKSSTLGSE